MSRVNVINKTEFLDLNNKNSKEYEDFLLEKLNYFTQNNDMKKYKICKNNELYRFFLYPPFYVDENGDKIKYVENIEQKRIRLKLKRNYQNQLMEDIDIDKSIKNIINNNLQYDQIEDNDMDADKVQNLLGIGRKTLYNLQDKNEGYRVYSYRKRLCVNKDGLLRYINNRHFCDSELNFKKMYSEIKKLKSYRKVRENNCAKLRLDEIIQSKEYKDKWEEYFDKIPENKRVYKDLNTKQIEGIKIYTKKDIESYFDIYNPNLKKCDFKDEIPQLYPASYWATILGVEAKTILIYCEMGLLPHYRIGAKHMISKEDFEEGLKNIKERKVTKANTGRRKKIESIFYDSIIDIDKIKIKYKDNINCLKYLVALEDKKVIELALTKLNNHKQKSKDEELNKIQEEIQEKNKELRKIKQLIIKYKRMFVLDIIANKEVFDSMINDVNKYYDLSKTYNIYKKELKEAKKENNITKINNISYLIKDYEEKMNKLKNNIVNKIK